jgi:phosphoribosylglycinamide formyltransferase-1
LFTGTDLYNLYKLGWFTTGRDQAARDLLEAVQGRIKSGEIKADIAFLFSNHEPGESIESDRLFKMAASYDIPLICFSYEKFRSRHGKHELQTGALPSWRLDYEREVMVRLQDYHPELCVLAGFMLIVGEEMCQQYDMINLHPAAPGGLTGTWQEVIWQLIDSKAEESGVMIHLVTPELDKGPPVTYCTYSIRGEPFDRYWQEIQGKSIEEIKREGEDNRLFRLIRQYGLAREFPLIIATLKAFSRGEVKINSNKKVINAEGKPIKGYNMTDEINELIRG